MELKRFCIGQGEKKIFLEVRWETADPPPVVREACQEVLEAVKGYFTKVALPTLPPGAPPVRVGVKFVGEPCFIGYSLTWQVWRGKRQVLGGQVFSKEGHRVPLGHLFHPAGGFEKPVRRSREAKLLRYGRAPFGYCVRGDGLFVLSPKGWERVAERKKEGDGASQKTAMVRK